MKLIALKGAAGSGKSTAAQYLETRHQFVRSRFAGTLKDMLRVLGLTEAHIEGELKEVPCDFLGGKTPRHAMQTLGTEWGRDLISQTLWLDSWKASVSGYQRVVVEDCRFENEAELVRSLGGLVVHIKGRGGVAGTTHKSEQLTIADTDVVVNNSGHISDLHWQLDNVLERLDL